MISNEVKSYTRNTPLIQRKPTDSEIKKLDEIIYYLINSLQYYRDNEGSVELIIAMDKKKTEIPIIQTDSVGSAFKEMLHVPMAAFVVAHELAHLFLINKSNTCELTHIKSSFDEELFCDFHGVRIAARTATKIYNGSSPPGWQMFASVGSVFFLSCLDITQKAAFVLNNGISPPQIMEEVDTHAIENNMLDSYPTTLFRLSLVRSALFQEFEEAFAPHPCDWVFQNCDWIDTFFVECWKTLKGYYLNRYDSKKKMYDIFRRIRKNDSV